jgi:hypothetical protein
MGTNITDKYPSQNKFSVALLDNLLGQGNFKLTQYAQTGRQKNQASMRQYRQPAAAAESIVPSGR